MVECSRIAWPRKHHAGLEGVARLNGHHDDRTTDGAVVYSLGGAVVLEPRPTGEDGLHSNS